MGYYHRAKVLFHRKAFLLVLNTTHHRKTAILYLCMVLSIIHDHPFPLGKHVLISCSRDLTPSLFVLPMRLIRKEHQHLTLVKRFSLPTVKLSRLILLKDRENHPLFSCYVLVGSKSF